MKTTGRSKKVKADEVTLTVRLTPEGIKEAYAKIAIAKQRLRAKALEELRDLADRVSQRSTYTSEEEVNADIEEAREAYYREREHR